ncbi:MAG: MFS transporter, partial [Acidimicrobiia bacterium]|nr:MFS transporter [Acidimicrobiia bacterium]
GSFLLAIGFALPFFVDAGTFAVAAALVFLITGQFRAQPVEQQSKTIDWGGEIKEGFLWLWQHPVLRPLAIVLGFLNALGMMVFSTFILFAQEELDLETGLFTGVFGSIGEFFGFESVGALIFALLISGGAIGGIIGSVAAPRISARIGSGPSLYVTMISSSLTALVIGFASRWWVAFLMFAIGTAGAVLWNVITVSLRQTIIPDHLLGRVNSVYRFFGWGMMPIGSALGGLVMVVGEAIWDRPIGLRLPYFVVAVSQLLLFLYAAPRLTTQKMEAARAEGIAAHESAD